MPVSTLVATTGATNANSYCTLGEANQYFLDRIPVTPPWVTSGDTPNVALLTATRELDALAQPFKTLVPAQARIYAYYRIRRMWTGNPATPTQKLAWPRVGMFDHNNNPLDMGVVSISVSVGGVTTVVLDTPHLQVAGNRVFFFGTMSTPIIDGEQTIVTVIDKFTLTFTLAITVAGGQFGRMTFIPDELKKAESEFAQQLTKQDRTLDNDVIIQGLTSMRAGSVSLGFKDNIVPQVIPDAVFNIMPQSWLTDEGYEPALKAEFGVVSKGSPRFPRCSGTPSNWWD